MHSHQEQELVDTIGRGVGALNFSHYRIQRSDLLFAEVDEFYPPNGAGERIVALAGIAVHQFSSEAPLPLYEDFLTDGTERQAELSLLLRRGTEPDLIFMALCRYREALAEVLFMLATDEGIDGLKAWAFR